MPPSLRQMAIQVPSGSRFTADSLRFSGLRLVVMAEHFKRVEVIVAHGQRVLLAGPVVDGDVGLPSKTLNESNR